jgi:adenylate kinase family enzyme
MKLIILGQPRSGKSTLANNLSLAKIKISPKDMLKLARIYDTDWTTKRDDDYLLKLFYYYHKYAKR